MTGVKVPTGMIGVGVVAHQTLPFTGFILGTYVALGAILILAGVGLRLYSRFDHS